MQHNESRCLFKTERSGCAQPVLSSPWEEVVTADGVLFLSQVAKMGESSVTVVKRLQMSQLVAAWAPVQSRCQCCKKCPSCQATFLKGGRGVHWNPLCFLWLPVLSSHWAIGAVRKGYTIHQIQLDDK